MSGFVPMLSIVFMGVSALAGLALPVLLFFVIRKKHRLDAAPFFIGCAVFLLFALIFEGFVNNLILSSPLGGAIMGNVFLTGAFGSLMAGLFEETGRYVAFRTVLKKKLPDARNALLYGAGHGGFEAFIILCAGMISNIVLAALLNAGMADLIRTTATDAAALARLEGAFTTLAQTPSWMFLVGIVERIAAIALHVALSVLVWFAAREKRRFYLYPLAVLLHALVNFFAVVLAGSGWNVWLVEGAIYLLTALCMLLACKLWRRQGGGERVQGE